MAYTYTPYQPFYTQYPQMMQPQIQPQIQPQVQQQVQPQQVVPQTQQATQQTQQGGFVSVSSEMMARNYPVAPGNSVTFIDENAPYCYVKTMGFSQLDRPRFEKYRLVKEEEVQPTPTAEVEYVKKTELDSVWNELKAMQEKIDSFTKKEVKKDESVDEQQ